MNYKMTTTVFFICITTFLCSVKMLHAQDSAVTLTLKDAVDMSVKNSKQLKNSRAKIDEATSVLHQAKDQRLPDFKISGSYLRLNNPNVDLKYKSGSGSSDTSSSNIKVSQAFYGLANITYPIYSGMRVQYGIESAKYLEQAAKLDADNDREGIIINAINAYINLYKAKEAVILVKENLSQSKQRDSDFSSLERNGILARNDLLKSELQTSNIELSLLDAENNAKLANLNMDLMLGLPEKADIIQDSSSFQAPGSLQDVISYEQLAMQNRNDMKSLSFRQKASLVGIKSAKSEYYPSVALSGGYVALDVPGLFSVTNALNVGIGVQYSLSSLWKTKAKVDQAKARDQQMQANIEMMNDNVKYEVNDAYNGYLLTLKKIDVYNKAIDQSQENYKITKNKYDNSLETLTDLLEADVARLQSKLNAVSAKADAIAAYNKLMQVAGLLNNQSTIK